MGWIKYYYINWKNFKGRSSRKELWIIFLYLFITQIITNSISNASLFLGVVLSLLIIFPYPALLVRRLHDAGHTGKWVFFLIPAIFLGDREILSEILLSISVSDSWLVTPSWIILIVSAIAIVGVFLTAGFVQGSDVENKYGSPVTGKAITELMS